MEQPTGPRPVFISYAHEDNESPDRSKRWLDRLTQFLDPLVAQDELTIYSDQDIDLGDDWHANIQAHLDGARAAVLLVSPAFLASKYVRSSELPRLLRNATERGVKIVPIIVRRCLVNETKFKYPDPRSGPEEFTLTSIQAPNSPTTPLSAMTEDEQDEVLLRVARSLIKLVAPAVPLPAATSSAKAVSDRRSASSRRNKKNPRTAPAQEDVLSTPHGWYNRGLRFLSEADYDAALHALNRTIELDPAFAYAYYNRGLTHYYRGEDGQAIRDFDRAVELGFRGAIVFRNRANTLARVGDVARALADYAEAIDLEPENALAYLNRGMVHENTLQRAQAIADYRTVLSLEAAPEVYETARSHLRAMGIRPAPRQDSSAFDRK